MRVVIQQLAIFLLPLLLLFVYQLWRQRRARLAGEDAPPWERGHVFWAVVAGLVLSILAFFVLDLLIEQSPEAPFRPPSWQR